MNGLPQTCLSDEYPAIGGQDNDSSGECVAPAVDRQIYLPFGIADASSPEEDSIPFNVVPYIFNGHEKARKDSVLPLHLLMADFNRVVLYAGLDETRRLVAGGPVSADVQDYFNRVQSIEKRRSAFALAIADVLGLDIRVDSILRRMQQNLEYREEILNKMGKISSMMGSQATIKFDQIDLGIKDCFTAPLPRSKRPKGNYWQGKASDLDQTDLLYTAADASAIITCIENDGGRVLLPRGGDHYPFFGSTITINEALRYATLGVAPHLNVSDNLMQSALSTHQSLNGLGFRKARTTGEPVAVDPYYDSQSGNGSEEVLRVPLSTYHRGWIHENMFAKQEGGDEQLMGPAKQVLRHMNIPLRIYLRKNVFDVPQEKQEAFKRRVSAIPNGRLSKESFDSLKEWAFDETGARTLPHKFHIDDYEGVLAVFSSDVRRRVIALLTSTETI